MCIRDSNYCQYPLVVVAKLDQRALFHPLSPCRLPPELYFLLALLLLPMGKTRQAKPAPEGERLPAGGSQGRAEAVAEPARGGTRPLRVSLDMPPPPSVCDTFYPGLGETDEPARGWQVFSWRHLGCRFADLSRGLLSGLSFFLGLSCSKGMSSGQPKAIVAD
jgi:hypothetical protein